MGLRLFLKYFLAIGLCLSCIQAPAMTSVKEESIRHAKSIAYFKNKFSQVYGKDVLTGEATKDGGASVMKFIRTLAQLSKENRWNDAIRLIGDIWQFPDSSIWCLPSSHRDEVIFDAQHLPTSMYDWIASPQSPWMSLDISMASLNHAFWPDFKLRVSADKPPILLNETPNEEAHDLKVFYILMVAEELAHALQVTIEPGKILALSQYMKNRDDYSLPAIARRDWIISFVERDVFAFLVETFGRDIVPRAHAKLHWNVRRPVAGWFYSASIPQRSCANLLKILTAAASVDD